ncbi:hypothetical protein E4U48_004937 [Claviceps purpurea]|nr:hypothetical protein E4U48_004937 [Claviceps purpurea]
MLASSGPKRQGNGPRNLTAELIHPLTVIPPADFVKRLSGMGYDMYIFRLLWNALKPSTRKTYSAATRSYETFCEYHRRRPYPVRRVVLVHWISGRAYGKYDSLIKKQRQVRPTTISAYVAALRSVHIDLDLPTDLFDGFHMIMRKASLRSILRFRLLLLLDKIVVLPVYAATDPVHQDDSSNRGR